MDIVYLVDLFMVKDACVHLDYAALANDGKAFACGIARAISGSAAVVATIGVVYMLWIVWSYCEEVESHGHLNVIGELLGPPLKADNRPVARGVEENGYGEYGSVEDVMA